MFRNPAKLKRHKWHQGYIDPGSCKKYSCFGKPGPIPYRSSYERRFMEYCEKSDNIECWGYECCPIEYISYDNKKHTYWPDFYVKIKDQASPAASADTAYLIEIKPKAQTSAPGENESRYARREFARNTRKWNAARAYAEKHNMQFIILTEDSLFPRTKK